VQASSSSSSNGKKSCKTLKKKQRKQKKRAKEIMNGLVCVCLCNFKNTLLFRNATQALVALQSYHMTPVLTTVKTDKASNHYIHNERELAIHHFYSDKCSNL
jgi:hypothetical protein